MAERRVKFGRYELVGVLRLPTVETSVCAITCHGLISSKDSEKYATIAHVFGERGMAVFRFDFRGCGESKGMPKETTLTHRIEDLQAALDFVEGQGFKRVGVMGSSLGGCVAILTASEDERIKALATWATPAYLTGLFSEAIVQRFPRLLKDAKRYSITESLRRVNRPILIIHGSLDEQVPPSHAEAIYRAANEPKSLQIIEGADHAFTNPLHRGRAIGLTLEWFKKYL